MNIVVLLISQRVGDRLRNRLPFEMDRRRFGFSTISGSKVQRRTRSGGARTSVLVMGPLFGNSLSEYAPISTFA